MSSFDAEIYPIKQHVHISVETPTVQAKLHKVQTLTQTACSHQSGDPHCWDNTAAATASVTILVSLMRGHYTSDKEKTIRFVNCTCISAARAPSQHVPKYHCHGMNPLALAPDQRVSSTSSSQCAHSAAHIHSE